MELLIRFAGLLHLFIAATNFPAAKIFDYLGNMRRVSPFVREVFIVQNLYIVLIVSAMAALCFAFSRELAGATLLGRCLSGFFCVFWTLRLLIQLFFYDAEVKRRYALMNFLFTLTFIFMATLFGVAASGIIKR